MNDVGKRWNKKNGYLRNFNRATKTLRHEGREAAYFNFETLSLFGEILLGPRRR